MHQESRSFAVGGAGGLRAAGGANSFNNPQYHWSGWVALIWGALLVVRGLRLFVFGEWIKTGARRACSGCCANSRQTGGATAAGLARWSPWRARAAMLSISPPLPCWTMALRDITSGPPARRQSHELLQSAGSPLRLRGSPAGGSPANLDDRGLDPSVGSSRISSCKALASARPIASCCCWPPDKSHRLLPLLAIPRAPGKLVDLSGTRLRRMWKAPDSPSAGFLPPSGAEISRALGDVGDPSGSSQSPLVRFAMGDDVLILPAYLLTAARRGSAPSGISAVWSYRRHCAPAGR